MVILPKVLVADLLGLCPEDPLVEKVRMRVAAKMGRLPPLFCLGVSMAHFLLTMVPQASSGILRGYARNIRSLCWFVYLDAEKNYSKIL